MKYLKDIQMLKGVKVLLRLDLNVPVKNGVVMDDFRIRKIIPTISYLREKQAEIIIISHIETVDNPTLEPICRHLKKLGVDCTFIKDYKKSGSITGDILLLENLRDYEGEKKNDRKFAKELASLADIYVNEAFAVSHRAHASVSAITEFIPSYAGILFEQEIQHLSTAFHPDHPFLFILGGAKFETKLPLIEKFIDIADRIFIGGALANDFLKEEGKDIKKSLVSKENFNLSRFLGNPKLMLPIDDVWKDDAIMDIGQKSIELLEKEIKKAKYILWNGPLGEYELGFMQSTLDVAQMIAEATQKGKHGEMQSVQSIVGGGDTLAVIDKLKIEDRFTFVSTGGGAMLEFLAKGTLPGIEALEASTQ